MRGRAMCLDGTKEFVINAILVISIKSKHDISRNYLLKGLCDIFRVMYSILHYISMSKLNYHPLNVEHLPLNLRPEPRSTPSVLCIPSYIPMYKLNYHPLGVEHFPLNRRPESRRVVVVVR